MKIKIKITKEGSIVSVVYGEREMIRSLEASFLVVNRYDYLVSAYATYNLCYNRDRPRSRGATETDIHTNTTHPSVGRPLLLAVSFECTTNAIRFESHIRVLKSTSTNTVNGPSRSFVGVMIVITVLGVSVDKQHPLYIRTRDGTFL